MTAPLVRVSGALVSILGVAVAQLPLPIDSMHVIDPDVVPTGDVAVADFNHDGVVDVLAGNAFLRLPPRGAFSVECLDPRGEMVGRAHDPVVGIGLAVTTRVAAGDLVGDDRPDVVVVDSLGRVQLLENLGHVRRRANFGSPLIAIDLGQRYGPLQQLEVVLVPVLFTADVDRDGFEDLVLAGHIASATAGTDRPMHLHVLFGDGSGGFPDEAEAVLSGSAVAGRYADFDGDGVPDTLALLTDQTAGGSYTERIERFRLVPGRRLRAAGVDQLPFGGRGTNLAIADLDGDGLSDYAVSVFHPPSAGSGPELFVIAGETGGKPGSPRRLEIPAVPPVAVEILGLRVVDLDRDGNLDVLSLLSLDGLPARLVWHRGRGRLDGFIANVQVEGGAIEVSNRNHVTLTSQPFITLPDILQVPDFDLDGGPDVLVAGLRDAGVLGGVVFIGSHRNTAPASPDCGGLQFVGRGTVRATGADAKAGLLGGRPLVGNGRAAVSLTEVPPGVPCALVCGPFEYQVTLLGRTLYTVPVAVLPAVASSATAAGGGQVRQPLPIPANPWLAGRQAYFQWVYLDPAATGFPVAASDAVEVTFGR